MVNIGVIGLGGAGRAHIRRLRRNRSVGRILAFDVKPHTVRIADEEVVDNLEGLYSNVDAVSICTPEHIHLSGIVRSLDEGKHVLVEKPMVASHAEALELEPHLLAHENLVFAVHHQMRHAAPFRKAKELIESGVFGQVFYMEANYWHDMRPRSLKFDNWRMEQGQSLIFGHACHPLDLLMNLAGTAPDSHRTFVSKNGYDEYATTYTSATTIMTFPGNIVAKCHINSCCEFPQFNNLMVLGDKASYIDGLLYNGGRFKQVAGFFEKGRPHVSVNIVDIRIPKKLVSVAFNTYLRTMNWISNRLMSHPDFGFRQYPFTVYNHDDACQVMIDNFIGAVEGREKVLVGYEDAARVIKLCEEAEADGLKNLSALNRNTD